VAPHIKQLWVILAKASAALWVGALVGCAAPATSLQAVVLEAGPNWRPNQPIERQDLGGHFAYAKSLFEQRLLIANGPTLDDQRGLYLYKVADRAAAESIVAKDPGVSNGTLRLARIEGWTLGIDQLGNAVRDGAALFVLEYRPGSAWAAGKGLDGQPGFAATVDYVTGRSKLGEVLAAGPVNERHARVIVAMADAAAARRFADADPGTSSGLFNIEVRPWLALQRQTTATR
jgi:uncharacterized protein YciI